MRPVRQLLRQHGVLAVFLGTMCVLGGALARLGWQLIEQDRQLESQRVQERLEQAAERVAGVLKTSLQDFDRWLTFVPGTITESLPDGLTLIVVTERGITVNPAGGLLYLPPAAPAEEPPVAAFAAGERMEFRGLDPAAAAGSFRALSTSPKPEVRAGALLRLGRNLRRLERYQEALQTYEQLALLKNVSIGGVPAELMALDAKCTVLDAMGRRDEVRKAAALMDSGLRSCRWSLPGPAWDFYRQEAGRWTNTGPLADSERRALAVSRAAEWVCRAEHRVQGPKGYRILSVEDGPVLVSWSAYGGHLAAVLAGPDWLNAVWKRARVEDGIRAALANLDGGVVFGSFDRSAQRVMRIPSVAGLPATLLLTPIAPYSDPAQAAVRRRALLAGFAVLALILVAGSYFILRSMARERAVARLQSEFVSAVSHEFRTPLTSLRQWSEMLAHDRIPTEEQRRQSYDIIFHATERLQRLVESLLDFGRMEAAAFRYRFDEMDLRDLVGRVVEEFRTQAAGQEHEIDLTQAEDLPTIHADREAIGLALWNLLDNAVKYSPDCHTVWVETKREDSGASVAVRDNGLGIDSGEQGQVFDKFFRGSAARASNIRGTGIGLSITRHIVRAHGGDIRVQSEPGKGSTFTMFVPAERQV